MSRVSGCAFDERATLALDICQVIRLHYVNIWFTINIQKSLLTTGATIAYVDDDFLRLLKPLYENAFEAVESAECKEIYSEIAKDDDGGFTLIIKNNGDILPSGHQNQPFELGYTTKNGPGRGYGLAIVKELIDSYQGSIDLRGSDGYTQVIIKLPFKENYTPIQAEKFEGPVLTLIK